MSTPRTYACLVLVIAAGCDKLFSLDEIAPDGSLSPTDVVVDGAAQTPQCDGVVDWRDDFADSQIDQVRWETYGSATTSVAEVAGELVLSAGTGAIAEGTYADLMTRAEYDLTNRRFAVRLVELTDLASNLQAVLVARSTDGTNLFAVVLDSAVIGCGERSGNVYASVCTARPFEPSAHRYWSIRHDGMIHFETSNDGVSWVALGTRMAPFAITNLKVGMYIYMNSAGVDPGAAKFDDFLLCRL